MAQTTEQQRMCQRRAAVICQWTQSGIDRCSRAANLIASVVGDVCAGGVADQAETGGNWTRDVASCCRRAGVAGNNSVIDGRCACQNEDSATLAQAQVRRNCAVPYLNRAALWQLHEHAAALRVGCISTESAAHHGGRCILAEQSAALYGSCVAAERAFINFQTGADAMDAATSRGAGSR